MRPHTASVSERTKTVDVDTPSRHKTISGSRSPGSASRKSKRSKNLESKSIYSSVPHYSDALSKTTTQLSVYNKHIERLQDEKSVMQDLISRIKLEIKHTRDGTLDCTSHPKRHSSARK
jgi:N-acetylmuramoyl-L-alanine amidase CwlA